MPLPILFDLELAHGRALAVTMLAGADVSDAMLADEEKDYARALAERRRRTWIAGRIALRMALARQGIAHGSLLATARGAPLLPEGVAGSVSHKDHVAVALVARERRARLGVDVELDAPRPYDVARHVLTDDERAEMAHENDDERQRAVLLRFSAKESIYKAVDPFVKRYVGFKEAYVAPQSDGSARAELRLRPEEGRFDVEVRWLARDGLFLTTARVQPA